MISFERGGLVKYRELHRWDVTPREAMEIQRRVRSEHVREDRLGEVRHIAGADVAVNPRANEASAGVIVYRFPDLVEVERRGVRARLTFPYVPGLLVFREGPVLLQVFDQIQTEPDVILFDGHGYSHPRRFGFACHMGVVLDRPSIGCAKSLLIGEHTAVPNEVGAHVPLVDGEELIGAVVRTRKDVQPIFVSIGHRVSLETAVRLTLACSDGFRVPRPTREADHYVEQLKLGRASGSAQTTFEF